MIVLIVLDGLRPDMITEERMPFAHRRAGQGVFCTASHAAFPTATRVNSASLTTGCYPGRHGIVDNTLYVPAIDSRMAVSCADWQSLQSMADSEGERLLSAPTLGEVLRSAGRRMASAGSGSPGTTYLTNPTTTGPVVNWAAAWPEAAADEVRRRLGPFPGQESTLPERNDFVLRAVADYLAPSHPDVMTIWLTEPDHTQHQYGLGSAEAGVVLANLDSQLEQLVEVCERNRDGQENTYVLFSDHGFSTIVERVDVEQQLTEAKLEAAPSAGAIIHSSDSLYLTGAAQARLGDVIRFMAGQPWVGALFVRDDLVEACPGAMPQSAVSGTHRRSAEIMFAYNWSPAPNRDGVLGSAFSSSPKAATHGSTSPYDINNCLVVWGRGIRQAMVSTVPCGIVDVAPTVLHLLGLEPAATMEGRVLRELLTDGPSPEEVAVTQSTCECTYVTTDGPRHQVASYSWVDGHRYLDQVTLVG